MKCWRRWLQRCSLGLLTTTALAAPLQRVEVPSLDPGPDGQPLRLVGFWSPAPTAQPAGALLLLHGCGGPFASAPPEAGPAPLSARMRSTTHRLNGWGWSVLVLDSLSARGERELCTQPLGARKLTQAQRRLDAWGGLAWLAQQPGVDAQRLGVLGWSHGGSSVLAVVAPPPALPRPPEVPAPAFAVAYYPGCGEVLRSGRSAQVPLLLQLGGADDWTPAAPCLDWAKRASDTATVEVVWHPGAHHGFDSTAPLRWRGDVPNGARPGQGVHVGGQAQALERSLQALQDWLARF